MALRSISVEESWECHDSVEESCESHDTTCVDDILIETGLSFMDI